MASSYFTKKGQGEELEPGQYWHSPSTLVQYHDSALLRMVTRISLHAKQMSAVGVGWMSLKQNAPALMSEDDQTQQERKPYVFTFSVGEG